MELSFPFDATDLGGVPDRRYASADIAAVAKLLWSNGVLGVGDLAVSAGDGMTVEVAPGGAVIDGRFYVLDAPKSLPIAENASGLDRIDLVALRLDYEARAIYPVVIEGVPASSPTRPAPLSTATKHDIMLAAVQVPNACYAMFAGYLTTLSTQAAGV